MRSKLCLTLAVALLASPALADYYVAGDFNGWDPAGDMMTDLGGGVFGLDLTLGPNERHEFKVTIGDWSDAWPESGNGWLFTDDNGHVYITYDTNVYDDGWLGQTERLGLDVDPGAWTAVGDWQGWDNANAATAMTNMGGGIYMYEQDLDPGDHMYKAVVTGSWDAIGADARSVNADNINFTTDDVNNHAIFWVDALTGVAKVEVVPEPATLALLALGCLTCLRRR